MKKVKETKSNGIVLKLILVINLIMLIGIGWLFFEKKQKIAFVQSTYLLSNYQGFKDASLTFKQKSTIWQANIDTLAAELKGQQESFKNEMNKLSAKEKELTRELIKTKEQQLRQYQQGIQQKAAQEDQQMTTDVVKEVNAFLKEYGEKHNFKIIFGATDAGNIVYAEEAMDVTEEVLVALNKNYLGE